MSAQNDNKSKFINNMCKILNIDEKDENVLERIYATCRDIVNERDIYYRAMDNCADSFHITDKDGKIIFVNKIFEKKVKTTRENILGKNVLDMEEEGFYKPSAPRLALKEKRTVSIIQSGVGGDAVVTATPIANDNGDIDICVSNARFIDELSVLNNYINNKHSKNTNIAEKVVYKDENMNELYSFAKEIAITDTSILITGETGTGKSHLAQYIHDNSDRSKNKFVEINCATMPENLIESELFGYESGAFSGASKGGKPGLFEVADKGTIFLDEIGDMPLHLQVKLLSIIQNKKVIRVGGTYERKIDVRIITATNRNLEKMMEAGEFRKDLYYRINVVPICMPPLRDRKEDIINFINLFLERYNKRYKKAVRITDEVIAILSKYSWPGNIRELENLMERLVVTMKTGLIEEEDIPANIRLVAESTMENVKVNNIIPLKEALDLTEKQLVQMAYKEYPNTYKVAEILGISQSGASRKYIKYVKDAKNDPYPGK